MSAKNYTKLGLNALLKLLEDATPENQPTGEVLRAYFDLVKHHDLPAEAEISELRAAVEGLRQAQTSFPNAIKGRELVRRMGNRGYGA